MQARRRRILEQTLGLVGGPLRSKIEASYLFGVQPYGGLNMPFSKLPCVAVRPRWRGQRLIAGSLVLMTLCLSDTSALQALRIGSLEEIGQQRMASAAEALQASARELPSDAETIAHFKAHRVEFEALVMLYQTHGHIVSDHPEHQKNAALLKRAGLNNLSGDSAIWLPEPYSVETAEKARGMNPFHAYAHHGVLLRMDKLIPSPRVQGLVWKDYFYVPVVPRVEQGRLWWPRSRYSGDLRKSARVFDSLDEYPQEWLQKRPVAECVYRRVEPQWFLRLCTSR